MLPSIKSPYKYNNPNTRIYEKYYRQFSIRNHTPQPPSNEFDVDKSVGRKTKANSIGEINMKKLKKQFSCT
jgi:hypothetical protein